MKRGGLDSHYTHLCLVNWQSQAGYLVHSKHTDDGCGSKRLALLQQQQKKQRRDDGGEETPKPQEFERMEKSLASLSAAFNWASLFSQVKKLNGFCLLGMMKALNSRRRTEAKVFFHHSPRGLTQNFLAFSLSFPKANSCCPTPQNDSLNTIWLIKVGDEL